jgi:hypothetical protein
MGASPPAAGGLRHGEVTHRAARRAGPATENGALNRVEPGDPERSYLILKLRGDPSIVGARMPFDGPPYLSPEQIDGIAAWIRAGAANN